MLYPLITFGLSDAVLVAVGGWLVADPTTGHVAVAALTTGGLATGAMVAPGASWRGRPSPGIEAGHARRGA